MTTWDRARDAFEAGMTEVDEHFRAPLFRQAVLLLRAGDTTAIETEQADDIPRLLHGKDPRNSRPYLALATRVHDRFRDRECRSSPYASPMTEPAEWGVDLGPLVPSTVVGEVFWAMDHPDEGGDGGSGVREPRRPLDSPPSLATEAEPNRE